MEHAYAGEGKIMYRLTYEGYFKKENMKYCIIFTILYLSFCGSAAKNDIPAVQSD